ncbi:hypothetical protein AB0M47_10800 [Hamadaea sp. NPDC051192]|uniref:hypothetical protein n=1 Tax=Hamadaea sp. NPDC051192 TaxID=3154940 RepID=UPI00343ED40D
MTAIASEEPFSDEYLRGLPSMLRQRSAMGLWHLAAAATSTEPEEVVLRLAEDVRNALWAAERRPSDAEQRVLRIAEALENDIAWHSDARFEVATAIARDLLIGSKYRVNEEMLYEQGQGWNDLRLDLAITGDNRSGSRLREKYSTGLSSYDWTGRGATAVWRAERVVEVEDFDAWLTGDHESSFAARVVRPPGWSVAIPDGWRTAVFRDKLPEPYAAWAAAGKVLAVPLVSRVAAWPLQTVASGDVMPVLGIEPLVKAADRLRPELISGFAEAVLIDWRASSDAELHAQIKLLLPVDDAMRFGLISEDERQQLLADARLATSAAMDQVIDGIAEDDLELRARFQRARTNASGFQRLARTIGVRFAAAPAMWPWPGGPS